MDELQDDLLKGKGHGTNSGLVNDYYAAGFLQLEVTEEQITRFGNLMHTLSNISLENLRPEKYPEKGVTNDHHRHLRGAIFAFGTEGVNKEWREHAACSIREMISTFSNSDIVFINALQKFDTTNGAEKDRLNDISDACKKIKKYYHFFCGVTHHQQAAITNGYRQLEDPNTENEMCLTADSFKMVFKHFFSDMKKITEKFPDL